MKLTTKLSLLLACSAALTAPASFADTDAPATAAAPAQTADATPKFEGVIVTKDQQMFNLSNPGVTKSQWVGVGDTFGAWTVSAYDDKSGELLLKNFAGTSLRLSLAEGKVGEAAVAPPTLADAQRVLDKMHFGKMMAKILEGQKANQLKMIRQMLQQKGMSADQIAKVMAQQTKNIDRIWANLNSQDIENSMAQIYSEEFTTDQLSAISDFYGTDAGQAIIAKQPEIQQKLMATMMPKIMAATQQIQAEQKAQRAAAAAAPK